MKISKYVTKYDYIAYYTKQKAMWFYTNAEVEAGLLLEQEKFLNSTELDLTEDDEIDDEQDSKIDPLVFTKSMDLYDEIDVEDYEDENSEDLISFKSKLSHLKNVDDLNPLIIQGRILDEESKKFIVNEFNNLNDFVVYDFDKNKMNLEEAEAKTKSLIIDNNKIIIFQPVFIDFEKMIITKCDALVKDGFEIKIIETKGTSNLKKSHFLDLYYQKRLLDNINYLIDHCYDINYFLCCVKYERLNKNKVSFIISDHLNYTKSGFAKGKKEFSDYELMQSKIGIKEKNSTSINDLLTQSPELDTKKIIELQGIENEFDKVIEELWIHKNSMNMNSIPKNFVPSKQDKGSFKDTDSWLALKNLYILKQYNPFMFSGNVTNHSKLCANHYDKLNEPIMNFKNYFKAMYDEFLQLWVTPKESFKFSILNKSNLDSTLSRLKQKKVYFDFETINSAIRAIDNIFPFTQVVTQCSILKDHGNGIQNQICNNLMVDPKNIEQDWWTQVIDGLYEGDEYSYVVYNASFEKSRLKEMKFYIKDLEYHKKIDCIINNIFDLADFFDLNKKIFIINELYGLYSIKKVLPLIQKYSPELFKETKCLDYKTLEIGNGLICQNKSTCRFLNQINDDEWKHIEQMSKIYCENDVRAMVAVEHFITNYLINLVDKKE